MDIVKLLGKPTGQTSGSDLLAGPGKVIASDRTRSYLNETFFCMWNRPEADYYLTLMGASLVSIHSIRCKLCQSLIKEDQITTEGGYFGKCPSCGQYWLESEVAQSIPKKQWWRFWK